MALLCNPDLLTEEMTGIIPREREPIEQKDQENSEEKEQEERKESDISDGLILEEVD